MSITADTLNRRIRWGAIALAVASALAAVLMQLTGGVSLRVPGVRLDMHEPLRPAVIAGVAVILFVATHGPALRRRDLSSIRPGRVVWALLLTASGVSALFLLAEGITWFPDAYPTGDAASLSLYTLEATRGRVHVGPYSQFGWNHPGPLLFYLLAPLYALTDHHEMSQRVTALVVNVVAAGTMLFIARRCGGPLLFAFTAFAILLIEVRAGADLAFSAWNPHVTVLPLGALLFSAAAVAAGRFRFFPLTVGLASFVAQSHAGFLGVSLVLVLVPAVSALYFTEAPARSSLRRTFNAAAWLAALLWLPPLAEQIVGKPGNLSKFAAFMLDPSDSRPTFSEAVRIFSAYATGPFSPSFRLSLGKPAEAGALWQVAGAAVLLAAMLVAAVVNVRRRDRFMAALCFGCFALSLAGLPAILAIRYEVSDHQVFWVCLPATVGLAALAATHLQRWIPVSVVASGLPRAALVAAIVFSLTAAGRLISSQRRAAQDTTALILRDRILALTRDSGSYDPLLDYTNNSWGDAVGVVLQFAKRGEWIATTQGGAPLFGPSFAPQGDEDVKFLLRDADKDPPLVGADAHAAVRVGRLVVDFDVNPRR